MADITNLQVSLSFVSTDLDPREISAALGREPNHVHRAGEPTTGRMTGHVHHRSVWLLDSDLPAPAILNDHIHHLLLPLLPHAASIRGLLAQGWELSLRCAFCMGGEIGGTTVDREAIAALVTLGATLALTVYPDTGVEPED